MPRWIDCPLIPEPPQKRKKRRRRRGRKVVTKWGKILQNYAIYYSVSWNEFADLMRKFNVGLEKISAKRVEQLAEYGAVPSFLEGLAITHICGVASPLAILPDDPKKIKEQLLKKGRPTKESVDAISNGEWSFLRMLQRREG